VSAQGLLPGALFGRRTLTDRLIEIMAHGNAPGIVVC